MPSGEDSRITKIMLDGTTVADAAWQRLRWIPPDEMLRLLGEPPIARPVPPPEG